MTSFLAVRFTLETMINPPMSCLVGAEMICCSVLVAMMPFTAKRTPIRFTDFKAVIGSAAVLAPTTYVTAEKARILGLTSYWTTVRRL